MEELVQVLEVVAEQKMLAAMETAETVVLVL
jgi:hypothetical protein